MSRERPVSLRLTLYEALAAVLRSCCMHNRVITLGHGQYPLQRVRSNRSYGGIFEKKRPSTVSASFLGSVLKVEIATFIPTFKGSLRSVPSKWRCSQEEGSRPVGL